MSTQPEQQVLGITQTACNQCRAIVPAKIIQKSGAIYFRSHCPEHGEDVEQVSSDPEYYRRSLAYVKPAWEQREHAGDDGRPCPEGCGFCSRHEQHLCMPIVEITQRCDLACPICINSSGGAGSDLSLDQFGRMLDGMLASEAQIDVLNLSGGEPLLHPQLLEIVDLALEREGIVRVSISTNGLRFLEDEELLLQLCSRDVVISLQYDGRSDTVYAELRGRALAEEKARILDLLTKHDVTSSLTMTLAAGVNESELQTVVAALFSRPNIVSLMIQPLAHCGRATGVDYQRIGIPDVIRLLDQTATSHISADDFIPLPCSHPQCFALGFYLGLDNGGHVSMNRLIDATTMLDTSANRIVFGLDAGEHERVKDLIYDIWSGPVGAVPDSDEIMRTLKRILKDLANPIAGCSCFDPRQAFGLMERRVKSIFIHAFQDASTFDLARIRRCCQAYPQPDGRLIPSCVHNVLGGRE